MRGCIIFGGSGYIGTKLASWFLENKRFDIIHIIDIKETSLCDKSGVLFHKMDVRLPVELTIEDGTIEWIFNFAAIHREPGHRTDEYFETNINGAKNVCALAEKINCKNIFFTASISVYGPTLKPTDEYTLTMPNTPYGISKLTAEYIHQVWVAKETGRRLVSVRPGVIYGPGDQGNILRMIKAVKRGYFFLPTSPAIKKSYGYIYGLIESIEFMMAKSDKIIIYNYVEKETESLGDMIRIINETLNYKGKIIRIPFLLLRVLAYAIYRVNPNFNGIHPERVKKVARPTHVVPQVLSGKGFNFNFDFKKSLEDWRRKSPVDL